MAKTGLYGLGYVNEGAFFGKLRALLGREPTEADKQHIHHFVQQELDRGGVIYYAQDASGEVSRSACPDQAVVKAVSIGLSDSKGQELWAFARRRTGQRDHVCWSQVLVGTMPTVYARAAAFSSGEAITRSFSPGTFSSRTFRST